MVVPLLRSFESLKTSKKRQFQRLMLNTDMHNKQVVWGPQFEMAADGVRKVEDGNDGFMVGIVINPFGRPGRHVMAYCQVVFLEAQKMWDNKKFVVGLKGWKGRMETGGVCKKSLKMENTVPHDSRH